MAGFRDGLAQMDFLHEISSRMAAADSLHLVLDRIVGFITSVIPCDSCFVYVLEGESLTLRASKNPHAELVDHIGMQIGQGVTGWVAKHRQPVSIASDASNDPRFQTFKNIPEDLLRRCCVRRFYVRDVWLVSSNCSIACRIGTRRSRFGSCRH
jgi:uroporphyrinogen-III synthase